MGIFKKDTVLNRKNMRVALCFYGQLRQVRTTYERYILPNILAPNASNHQIDIFVHTWWDVNDLGKRYKVWGKKEVPETAPVPDDVLDTVFKTYNPLKILAERQILFTEKDYKPINPREAPIILPIPTQSKCYSYKQVSLLKRKYENENGFIYDMVVPLRFDQGMQNPVDFSVFPKGHYNTSPRANHVVDCAISFVDSDIYDYIADMYDYMDYYYRFDKVEFLEEHLLLHHLNKRNIPIIRHRHLNDYILVR